MSLSVHCFLPTAGDSSHDEVAERIVEYHRAGFDHFILSGQPHLEEAWWFGDGVIPRLRAADLLAEPVIPGDTPTWSRQRPSPN